MHQLGAPPVVRSLADLEVARTEQRGLVTRAQCVSAGLTSKAIEWRLRRGLWVRLHPGVYMTTPGRDDWWTTALAGQLAVPGAAWSHETAGYVWGLAPRPPRRIELVVPETRRVAPPSGVVVHRAVAADQRVDDLHWPWRTTPEETILDLSATATPDRTFALLGRAFQKRLTDEAAMLGRLQRRWRHPQRALLTLVLAAATDGVESAIEARYRDHVERPHGLPAGVRQLRRDGGGRERHDVGYREQRVLVELDGRLGHEGFEAQINDGRRDRRGAGGGWLTLRAFWPDVAVTPCVLAGEVGAVLIDRSWAERPMACRLASCALRR
jgi:hypothetical protein